MLSKPLYPGTLKSSPPLPPHPFQCLGSSTSLPLSFSCSCCRHPLSQVLDDGLFTSDPHPGNIMILPNGRLGLIDFGQAKELSTKQRIYLCRMVVAVANSDQKEILELAKASPFKTKHNNPDALIRYTTVVWEGQLHQLEELVPIPPPPLRQHARRPLFDPYTSMVPEQ